MSAATASIADVSRTDLTNKDDRRDLNNSGHSQAQCTPMPLPALGTQRIIQGNGTNVGTVISLQCPAKYKLVGGDLKCILDTNNTRWVGETYCKPLSPFGDHGFRVAVLASIVSSAIIFLMSMAFITCCLVDCFKEDKRKKQERESEVWQWEEQAHHQGDNRSRFSHKGRNNNNNNSQQNVFSLWDTGHPATYDNMRACRCPQQYLYGPDCAYGPAPPLSALPGYDYHRPLLPPNPETAQVSGPPRYFAPPRPSCQTTSPGLVQMSAAGPALAWQCGGRQGAKPSTTDESNSRNINPAKQFSIRIISV